MPGAAEMRTLSPGTENIFRRSPLSSPPHKCSIYSKRLEARGYAERTRRLKNDEKEVGKMSIIMEELIAEERRANSEEIAMNLLEEGTLPITTIARVANLPEERVRELAEKRGEPVLA